MSNVWTLLSQVTAEIFLENVDTVFPVKVYLCRAPCVHKVCPSKNRHSEVRKLTSLGEWKGLSAASSFPLKNSATTRS